MTPASLVVTKLWMTVSTARSSGSTFEGTLVAERFNRTIDQARDGTSLPSGRSREASGTVELTADFHSIDNGHRFWFWVYLYRGPCGVSGSLWSWSRK